MLGSLRGEWVGLRTEPGRACSILDPASPILSAPDRDDDFKLVAVVQRSAGMLAFRNDFAVFFDSDALAGVTEFFDEAGDTQRCGKLTGFAIDLEGNHPPILAQAG